MTAIAAVLLACATVVLVAALLTARRVERRLPRSAARTTGADRAGPGSAASRPEPPAVAHDRLAAALRVLPEGVMVVDAEGSPILVNAAAGRFTGARHADAIAEESIGQLLDQAREGQSVSRELTLFGPPRRTLHLQAFPLGDTDHPTGVVAFVHDITEARRVESVRRDFVANVSHELKTPIGALALLADTMAADDDPTVMRQLAERMAREADRLGRIVDDLLDLSLIEAQEAPTREPVPVSVLVSDCVERVRAAADSAGTPLDVGPVPPDLEVVCDRHQLTSAVVNLLDNAVKYSEAGHPVEVTVGDEGDRVAIAVRDQGVGIPRRDLERIFERFYRVDRARSRQTGGTGLGLSIVRHVVQAHGGEIGVESVEGEGSTFVLRLPLATRAARGLSEAS